MTRAEEIQAGLTAVRGRIAAACDSLGRDPAGVTLVAVSKTFPAADVRLLADLGARDLGENRDQEAKAKAAELVDLRLTWHFVGRLQRNKCRSVARYAAVVHSLDRPALVDALDEAAAASDRRILGLVQVSLDEAEGRGGARPADVPALADRVAGAAHLDLGGVMAVAPLDGDPAAAFGRLGEVASEVRAAHPTASMISSGMSGDLEIALAHGSTHLRVGTAVFGGRSPNLR